MDERVNENITVICSTCLESKGRENIKVVVLEDSDEVFETPAEHFFCCIFCRNVFINANKGYVKLDKDYGDTTAKIGVGFL